LPNSGGGATMLRPQRGERADETSHKTQPYESRASRRVSHLWLCASFRKGVEEGKVCPPVRDDSTIVALFRRNFTRSYLINVEVRI
jgi:hypothetical protein